jgi:hypothetical protein
MGLRRTLFCIAVCLCSALPASAFTLRHDTRGNVLRWPPSSLPVCYRIGVSGSAEADATLTSAVVRAFEAWNRAPGSYFRFRYAGRTSATRATPDGENCVIWVTHGWPYRPETIAYTTVWIDGLGRILDTDVELNAELFTWSPGRMPGVVDVQNAVTHECGHAVGLAHSLDSTETTMFPIILLGEVLKRSLEPDDVAGLRALYPVVSSELVLYEPVEVPATSLRPVLDGLLADKAGGAPTVVLRTDADGDGADELGVFRAGADPTHERPSFSLVKPNPGGVGALLVAYDEWEIPAGGEVEDAAALDTDGDGFEELVVLKEDPVRGTQEVLVYPMPTWGALDEAYARTAVARDAWRIPAGGPVLALFALRRPGGSSLGVVRATAGGALELELTTPPRPGDATEADAARGESMAVLLPDGFAMTDIDAADLDGDGTDEVIVLDQDGADATVRAYDVVAHPDGPALTLALRWSLPLGLPEQERALGLVGVDLDGLGLDQIGIRVATIR